MLTRILILFLQKNIHRYLAGLKIKESKKSKLVNNFCLNRCFLRCKKRSMIIQHYQQNIILEFLSLHYKHVIIVVQVFLLFQSPSFKFVSDIAFFTPIFQMLRNLPLRFLSVGVQFIICRGSLSSCILLTCPYRTKCFCLFSQKTQFNNSFIAKFLD